MHMGADEFPKISFTMGVHCPKSGYPIKRISNQIETAKGGSTPLHNTRDTFI